MARDMNIGTPGEFGGSVYENQDTASADSARRFATSPLRLRDVVIQVTTNAQLFGNIFFRRYRVGPGETMGFGTIDISTLYFINAVAGQNGTITILGVRE